MVEEADALDGDGVVVAAAEAVVEEEEVVVAEDGDGDGEEEVVVEDGTNGVVAEEEEKEEENLWKENMQSAKEKENVEEWDWSVHNIVEVFAFMIVSFYANHIAVAREIHPFRLIHFFLFLFICFFGNQIS